MDKGKSFCPGRAELVSASINLCGATKTTPTGRYDQVQAVKLNEQKGQRQAGRQGGKLHW